MCLEFVCSVLILVVVQPGDQLLSPKRRTDTPKAVREDRVDSPMQSKSQDPFSHLFLRGLNVTHGRDV